MSILRHYFISDSLDDLERVEQELEQQGVETAQIHTLSLDDTAAETHVHLHDVSSLMKKDVIRSGELGALVGAIGAVLVVGISYFAGLTISPAGWIPTIFLAIIVLGFCTWEGGFIGIQRTNKHFRRFESSLQEGKHVFFVDLPPEQEKVLEEVVANHSGLELAGTEQGTAQWLMRGQKKIPRFLRETLP
jgi:hypothetical protein